MHCCGWYGDSALLRLLMQTGVPIDYPDMYGNTALHYAVYKGHKDFIRVCLEEFHASLLVFNNGKQSIIKVIEEGKLALVPKEDWTVAWATEKARSDAKTLPEAPSAKTR